MFEDVFNATFQSRMNEMMVKLLERSMSTTALATGQEDTTSQDLSSVLSSSSSTSLTGDFASMIQQAAKKYNVNPALVNAVIKAESNFNASAVSSAGAIGLMQLMPATAKGLGVDDPLNPAQNIEGGVKFLSRLLKRYDGNVEMALAAYNAGPGAVDKYKGIPPYKETQTYVNRIMNYLQSSSSQNGWSA